MQNSIETTATVETNRHLVLDDEIPAPISKRVRVIVLLDEDIEENQWLRSAAADDVFEFLADDAEDIYSANDGSPLEDEA
ncbi:MAG TPA: hypothetical protein VEV84_02205 [Pyrinomonadaceae bacterium]|jgi:hypothetical protein|nr:hypothetical protein [Pyrinomonadaceae bacterium]